MKERLALFLAMVLCVFCFAGCVGSDKSSSSSNVTNAPTSPIYAADKDTIVIAYEIETPTLDIHANNALAAYYPEKMIYSGLFYSDENGNPQKDICESYSIEKDEKGNETIWIFRLRENVKFSDGSNMTAEDVVESLRYAQSQPTVAVVTGFYSSLEMIDDYTVKMITNGVYATVPEALTHPATFIKSAALMKAGQDYANAPIGTGPYRLVKWDKGEKFSFTTNEYYYAEKPSIGNIVFRILPEGTSRTIALEAGDIDLLYIVDPNDVSRLQNNTDITVGVTEGAQFVYLALNNTVEPYEDVNLRKIISSAIDRKGVITVARGGFGTEIYSCISTVFEGTTDKNSSRYDLAEAKEYLSTWEGDPASIELNIVVNNDQRRRAAEVIQSCLNEIGITKVKIEQVDSATLTQMYNSGNFVSYISAYTTSDLMTFLNGVYYTTGKTSSAYRQGELDMNSFITEISNIIDKDERIRKLTEVNELVNSVQPLVPLYVMQNVTAWNKNLANVEVDPMGLIRIETLYWN